MEPGLKVHNGGTEPAGKYGGCSTMLRAHILNCVHKVLRANWKQPRVFNYLTILPVTNFFYQRCTTKTSPNSTTNSDLSILWLRLQGTILDPITTASVMILAYNPIIPEAEAEARGSSKSFRQAQANCEFQTSLVYRGILCFL